MSESPQTPLEFAQMYLPDKVSNYGQPVIYCPRHTVRIEAGKTCQKCNEEAKTIVALFAYPLYEIVPEQAKDVIHRLSAETNRRTYADRRNKMEAWTSSYLPREATEENPETFTVSRQGMPTVAPYVLWMVYRALWGDDKSFPLMEWDMDTYVPLEMQAILRKSFAQYKPPYRGYAESPFYFTPNPLVDNDERQDLIEFLWQRKWVTVAMVREKFPRYGRPTLDMLVEKGALANAMVCIADDGGVYEPADWDVKEQHKPAPEPIEIYFCPDMGTATWEGNHRVVQSQFFLPKFARRGRVPYPKIRRHGGNEERRDSHNAHDWEIGNNADWFQISLGSYDYHYGFLKAYHDAIYDEFVKDYKPNAETYRGRYHFLLGIRVWNKDGDVSEAYQNLMHDDDEMSQDRMEEMFYNIYSESQYYYDAQFAAEVEIMDDCLRGAKIELITELPEKPELLNSPKPTPVFTYTETPPPARPAELDTLDPKSGEYRALRVQFDYDCAVWREARQETAVCTNLDEIKAWEAANDEYITAVTDAEQKPIIEVIRAFGAQELYINVYDTDYYYDWKDDEFAGLVLAYCPQLVASINDESLDGKDIVIVEDFYGKNIMGMFDNVTQEYEDGFIERVQALIGGIVANDGQTIKNYLAKTHEVGYLKGFVPDPEHMSADAESPTLLLQLNPVIENDKRYAILTITVRRFVNNQDETTVA